MCAWEREGVRAQCHCHIMRNHLWAGVSQGTLLIGAQSVDDVSNYRWFTLRTWSSAISLCVWLSLPHSFLSFPLPASVSLSPPLSLHPSISLLLFDPPPIPFSISLELFSFNNDIDSHSCSIFMNYITTRSSSELGQSKKLEVKQTWLHKLPNLCQKRLVSSAGSNSRINEYFPSCLHVNNVYQHNINLACQLVMQLLCRLQLSFD